MEVEEVFARFRGIKHGIKATKKSTSVHYGDHKSGFKGAGYDIVGVDQWRPGQPLKDIATEYYGMGLKDRSLLQSLGEAMRSVDDDVFAKYLVRENPSLRY